LGSPALPAPLPLRGVPSSVAPPSSPPEGKSSSHFRSPCPRTTAQTSGPRLARPRRPSLRPSPLLPSLAVPGWSREKSGLSSWPPSAGFRFLFRVYLTPDRPNTGDNSGDHPFACLPSRIMISSLVALVSVPTSYLSCLTSSLRFTSWTISSTQPRQKDQRSRRHPPGPSTLLLHQIRLK
jgi:hypothetical protein